MTIMNVVLPMVQNAGASYIIKKLIVTASTYLRDQYYWTTDLQEELQKLEGLLPKIQAVVDSVEDRLTMYESSNPALIKWLWQFRDVIDEAEEVLDELEYLELEKKANSDIGPSFRPEKRFRKSDNDVRERLRACVKNLETSASEVETFLELVQQTCGIVTGQMQQDILPLTDQSRITSSLPGLSFKGREEEKRKIIQYLLTEESEIQISHNVNCLPLVAMGGMGKTALAQQVFDHFENTKKKHFDIKIWVCDSLPDLNASNLMKKILEHLTRQSESGSLELLSMKLKEQLHSKRYLLVLDDVWDDNKSEQWEKLCAPLRYGQKGSWILLTTRLESVAKVVSKIIRGDTIKPMKLPSLSKDECRSLLYEHAFAGEDPNEFPLLRKIGEKIVEKLDGVPLLAKSIGGVLNSKLEADHWTIISRSEVWKMPQDLNCEFLPALTLSYKMLPPPLKRCFSYCSIFPQDYKFNKQKLVCMWVAADLIYSDGSEEGSDEVIANNCFHTLCSKSFFDVHPYNWSPFYDDNAPYGLERDYYTMHDMLNGLARHVSRYECCRIENGAPSRNLNDNTIRHIYITSTHAQLPDIAKMVCKIKHLRTLWIKYYGGCQQLFDFIRDACKSPRRIRVLIVQSNDFKVSDQCLKSISDFAKLRFLEIPHCFSASLSMRKFCFLQFLIVAENERGGLLAGLAKDANKLTNLRHLHGVQEDALLLAAKVGKLTSLQQLCFIVRRVPGYRIDELMNMDNLRKLKIKQLSNVQSLKEANKVNLVKKCSLTRLELDWYGVSNPDIDHQEVLAALQPPPNHQEVLAALQPPPTIRELLIRRYKGGRHAPWMDTPSLSWLQLLQLESCTSWEELPPLWKLPCLKFLRLNSMKAIRSLGCRFSDQNEIQFPVLEELEFRDLPLWEEWNGADEYRWFPHLKSFQIEDCPELKKIPGLPSSLKTLEFENIDEHKDLASYLQGLTLLTTLHLHCSPGLESLPLASELEHLTALQDLHISDGEALTSPGGLYILKSLKSLTISACPKFLSAEVESQEFLEEKTRKDTASSSSIHPVSNKAASILPSSLEFLYFSDSEISQESLGRCLQGLTSLEELEVSCFHHLVSLPNIEYLHNLIALQTLKIFDCKELRELESLTILVSLRELQINGCPKLATRFSTLQNPTTTTEQSGTRTLPSLEEIEVDNIFYLPILPISKRLMALRIFNKTKESPVPLDFTCLPSEIEEWLLQHQESLELLQLSHMPHLQSLPASLERFSSLSTFDISDVPELKSLPKMPASVHRLYISKCSAELMKRCHENIGADWPNINHIRVISINWNGKDGEAYSYINWDRS